MAFKNSLRKDIKEKLLSSEMSMASLAEALGVTTHGIKTALKRDAEYLTMPFQVREIKRVFKMSQSEDITVIKEVKPKTKK